MRISVYFLKKLSIVDLLPVGAFSLANLSDVRIRNCGLLAFLGLLFAKSLSVRPTRADFSFVLNIVLADYSADILKDGYSMSALADLQCIYCTGRTMRGKAEGQREGDAGAHPHLPDL
jgi:hypothetical protein